MEPELIVFRNLLKEKYLSFLNQYLDKGMEKDLRKNEKLQVMKQMLVGQIR